MRGPSQPHYDQGIAPKDGAEHACSGIMLKIAVNGKAVHGTGGVNYLPHMFVLFACIHASAAVSLAQAIMQRIFVSARKHVPCRGAVQRLSTATTATRKTLNKLTCERVVRAPKGSLGPKGPIREIDPGSLWSYLTPSTKCPKAQILRVCGHDRTPCSITKSNTFTGYQPVSAL